MRGDAETTRDVLAAVDDFLDHLAHRRLEPALDCFAPDADVALYGSELSEVVIGPAALRTFLSRLLAGPAGPRFTLRARRLSACGDVAWLTAEADVVTGGTRVNPSRLTAVLERRGNRWLWMLFSGCEPLPDRA